MKIHPAVRLAPVVILVPLLLVAAARAAPQATPAPAAATEPDTLSASGVALIPPTAIGFQKVPQTLNVGLQLLATGEDARKAMADVEARAEAIRLALEQVGIPANAIRPADINVYPQQKQLPPVEKGAPVRAQLAGLNVNANLQVDVTGLDQLASATSAAFAAGATNVYSGGRAYGPNPATSPIEPPAEQVTLAVAKATDEARELAETLAEAAGRKLGPIRSVTATYPTPECCPPGLVGWRVQVTVTYRLE